MALALSAVAALRISLSIGIFANIACRPPSLAGMTMNAAAMVM